MGAVPVPIPIPIPIPVPRAGRAALGPGAAGLLARLACVSVHPQAG